MERMRVLVLEPLSAPEVRTIPHTLEAMQELVGGNIECTYPWPNDNAGLIASDDAIALGYPLNRALIDPDGNIYDIIKGTCFICGLSYGDFTDLPEDLIEKGAVRERAYWPCSSDQGRKRGKTKGIVVIRNETHRQKHRSFQMEVPFLMDTDNERSDRETGSD